MRRMFSISSARAPSPASAIATSPEARNSRNASADTVTATRRARPKRLVAKASMSRDVPSGLPQIFSSQFGSKCWEKSDHKLLDEWGDLPKRIDTISLGRTTSGGLGYL